MVHAVFRSSRTDPTSCLTGVLLLSILGLLLGWVPSLDPNLSRITTSSIAHAQSAKFDERQLKNYINALVDIEKFRDRMFNDVSKFYSQDRKSVPKNVCRLNRLPSYVQNSCDKYFVDSASIVERHNLSIREFNQIRTQARTDTQLKTWVHQQFCLRLPQEDICR